MVQSPELAELDRRQVASKEALDRLIDPPVESPTNGYHSSIEAEATIEKWVQVDLGSETAIDEVRLYPARPTDFADTPGFGMPPRYTVSVSSDAEFLNSHSLDPPSGDVVPGMVVVIAGEGVRGQYVRVTALELKNRSHDYVFALAEVQVMAEGQNVAAAGTVSAHDSIEEGRWSTRFLVDGYDSRYKADAGDSAFSASQHRLTLVHELAGMDRQRESLALAGLPADTQARLALLPAELNSAKAERDSIPAEQVYAIKDVPPRPVHVLDRGDVKEPRQAAVPGALACVTGLEYQFPDSDDPRLRRAQLAAWITDPANALTRRSIVNRVWQYHFGRGIVDTPNDFGRAGSPPSHPELLDWLAVEFMRQGESLKALHRLIVTSSVYRQTSLGNARGHDLDPDNRWLWRANRARLDAECVRDAALFVAGKLDLTMGGLSAKHFVFKDDHSPVYDYAGYDVDEPQGLRRSVYRFLVRSAPDPFMECLDCADSSLLVPKRNATLTALQALAMLNNPFMVTQSQNFSDRVATLDDSPQDQIDRACRMAWGRAPTAAESSRLVEFARKHSLPALCRALLNSNEFLFVD